MIGGLASLAVAALLVGSSAVAQIVQTVIDHGDPNEVYDIVILGDGYTAAEHTKFDADVAAVVGRMNAAVSFPLDDYIDCFNVHSVFRASVESGADDPIAGVTRNTAYDSTYNFGGSARCLYLASGAGRALAASDAALAPDTDGRVMVLVNSNQYGGCASTFSVSYTGVLGPGVQIHEWAHSFGGLADEYSYGSPGTYTGPEFAEPNVSNSSTGSKWSAWLGSVGPVGVVGAYQGARYYQSGAYRPEPDCNMRNIGRPFCSVCREHLIKVVHSYASIIGEPTGPSASIRGRVATFAFRNRIATRPFVARWRIDGGPWVTGGAVFDWDTTSAAVGMHTVEVELSDASPEVRTAAPGQLVDTHQWVVDVTEPDGLVPLAQRGAIRVVDGGGDADGDGHDDFVIGTPLDGVGGSVTVYSGRSLLPIHDWSSAIAGDSFGRSVAMAGDVDVDGFVDVAVAASGRVVLFSGTSGAEIRTLASGVADDEFGAVLDAFDADGDGFDDLAVGAPGGNGAVFVFAGFDGSVLHALQGASPFDPIGRAVCGIGDVDFDGAAEFAIGRPALVGPGAVEVYSGVTGSLLYSTSNPLLAGPRDDFGVSVANVGDWNGDTRDEFAVGAPRHVGVAGTAGGLTVVYDGYVGTPVAWFEGAQGRMFGARVAAAGDRDGDGLPEVATFDGGPDGGGDLLSSTSASAIDTILPWQDYAAVGDPDGDGYDEVVGTSVGAESALVLGSDLLGSPGRHWRIGAPCRGSDPTRRPRIGAVGKANLGGVLGVSLRGALPHAAAALRIGGQQVTPLDAVGMPGCQLFSPMGFSAAYTVSAHGAGWVPLSMPNGAGLVGVPLRVQWVIADPAAPYPIGISLSDALAVVIGR